MQTQVLFEHPLNEKMRTWLRIEFLIQQLTVNLPIVDHAGALHFFRNVSELLDVFERGEVRTELLKELDRQQRKLQTWIASLNPLTQALTMVLDLIRQSAPFRKQTSLNGFYQDNGGDADLLRLNLSLDSQLYPQISGHKSRFAIRFMPLDTENGQVPERLDFELACC
ncbi:cell division protein ZapD [Escherichia coli]|nr:cell division protein ZapD [Escherichia coli]